MVIVSWSRKSVELYLDHYGFTYINKEDMYNTTLVTFGLICIVTLRNFTDPSCAGEHRSMESSLGFESYFFPLPINLSSCFVTL